MNALRELVLILSTFLWLGAGIWIAVHLVATDPGISGIDARELAPRKSYYVFGAGIAVFLMTTYILKKKKED